MAMGVILIGLSAFLGQDPGQDGPMVTAPAPVAAGNQAPSPSQSPGVTRIASPLSDTPSAPARPAVQPAEDDAFDRAFANSHSLASAPSAEPRPLPPEALSDPVAYAAQQCRPGIRPSGEEIEACFTRIETQIRDARRAEEAARAPRTTCRQQVVRDQDGQSVSTEASCTISSGDTPPASIPFGD